MSRVPAVLAVLVFGSALGGAPPDRVLPQAPTPQTVPLEALLEELASRDESVSRAAQVRLSAMTIDPPPALVALTRATDPQMRARADQVVVAMRRNATLARMERDARFVRTGAADLFVAATANWELEPSDRRLWEPALEFAQSLIVRAEMFGDRKPSQCPALQTFDEYVRACKPSFTRSNGVYRHNTPPLGRFPLYYGGVQAAGVVEEEGLVCNIILSRGNVRVEKAIISSVVFVNGNITVSQQISRSVVICDGDIDVSGQITASVLVARGNVRVKEGATASYLAASGTITLRNQEKRFTADDQFVIVDGKKVKLLGVTFFELHRVGLEVKVADKLVSVAKVSPKSASEKAGLKVGDTILDVGGKAPADNEALRRLLRDALAVGDAAVKVRRGNETLTVKVALPE